MNKKNALNRLFRPKTIALFGGAPAAVVMRECRKIGFEGEFWPVHPTRDDINGVPCFRSVADLPGSPDASFLGTGPAVTIEVLRELSAIDAGGAVCYAAGFSETGSKGKALQEQLLEAAGDMAIIGPNCHGMINYLDGVALWPDEHGGVRVDDGVAIILQSGNIAISISMQSRGLSISHLITIGNKADLGIHDYINAMLDDPRVKAIGLHIEGLDNVPEFSEAAIRALKQKVPIAAIKAGASALGAELTLSHTSSLAGSDALYSALFRRLGIARCETIEGLVETLKFLSVHGVIDHPTVASMSCSGGEASMIADQADALGLEMPPLTAAVAAKLHGILGERVNIANPLDYHTYIWGDVQAMTDCYTAVLENGCACNILVIDYPRETIDSAAWQVAERALIQASQNAGRPAILMATIPENIPASARERLLRAGIAPMQGLKECMLAIRAAATIGQAQARVARIEPVAAVPETAATSRLLNEWDSKQQLAACGVPVPKSARCTAGEAAAAAAVIGFPVCAKILSDEISHKSDVGGVQLGLQDEDDVRAAIGTMRGLSEEFLVEEMITGPAVEMIVGIKREPGFGLALVIGAGGLLVEVMQDSQSLLLPASREDIAAAVDSLKISKLLQGYRGSKAVDREGLVDAIDAIGRFAMANRDRILELDVNPLLVLPDRAVAADALIRLAD